jgi:hypothetical protein
MLIQKQILKKVSTVQKDIERERERERERENTFILFKNIFVQCNCPVLILVILISHCA